MMRERFLALGFAGGLGLVSACEPPMLPDIEIPEGGLTSASVTSAGTGQTGDSTGSATGATTGASSSSGSTSTSTGAATTGSDTSGTSGQGSTAGSGAAGSAGAGGAGGSSGSGGNGSGGAIGPGGGAGAAGAVVDAGGDANRVDTGVTEDPRAAVAVLDGWRYEFPCGYVDGHTLATCSTGEICWPNATKAHFSEKKTITVAGDATKIYEVVLRIRGAIEPRDYAVACMRLPGSPANTIGIAEQCDGFANQQQVTFNVWEFKIADPPHVFYLNSVPLHPPHRVDPIDMQFTVQVRGRSSITFTMDDLNGGEIRNCSIVVPGIAPYPNTFDGNFFQLNIVSAKIVP